jgi:hypothetical protein
MRLCAFLLGSWAILGIGATSADANPILLTVVSGPMLQQKTNSPCVIGDPSCHNRGSIPFTTLPPHDPTDVVSSPVYTVDQIRSLVGNTFDIGVDLNQAPGQSGGAYLLNAFTLTANGVPLFSTSNPVTLTPLNPGNGFSDATIAGFDLTGLSGSTQIQFTTNFSGGTAGREQYFLRSAAVTGQTPSSPSPTPEPGTWLLVGTGAFALIRRKLQH